IRDLEWIAGGARKTIRTIAHAVERVRHSPRVSRAPLDRRQRELQLPCGRRQIRAQLRDVIELGRNPAVPERDRPARRRDTAWLDEYRPTFVAQRELDPAIEIQIDEALLPVVSR